MIELATRGRDDRDLHSSVRLEERNMNIRFLVDACGVIWFSLDDLMLGFTGRHRYSADFFRNTGIEYRDALRDLAAPRAIRPDLYVTKEAAINTFLDWHNRPRTKMPNARIAAQWLDCVSVFDVTEPLRLQAVESARKITR